MKGPLTRENGEAEKKGHHFAARVRFIFDSEKMNLTPFLG
jgi:hypothetical protein